MSFAAVDIGNTLIHLSVWNPDGSREDFETSSLDKVMDLCRNLNVSEVVYCTTRLFSEEDRKLVESAGWNKFMVGDNPILQLKYSTPLTLGPDRLAAAIGAASRFPGHNVLVADAGTALTLDIVTQDGFYIGGNIAPGVEMRLRALHLLTSKLPDIPVCGEMADFGHDTETAIRSGAVNGVANDIVGTFLLAMSNYGCTIIALTGGAANHVACRVSRLLNLIKPVDARVEYIPALVREGLKIAYEHEK